jgi:hypothetical protein
MNEGNRAMVLMVVSRERLVSLAIGLVASVAVLLAALYASLAPVQAQEADVHDPAGMVAFARPGQVNSPTLSPQLLTIDPPECVAPGVFVDFQVITTNVGGATQPDNPGPEIQVIFPAQLSPQACTIVQGGGTCSILGQQVVWNGSIPAGGSVILDIRTRVTAVARQSTIVCVVATTFFDLDLDGISESSQSTETCIDIFCPAGVDPNQQLGAQVHLPILNFQGQNDVCRTWIEVQNIGDEFSKAALVTWGEPGFCPPQCAGPLKVECSGLLKPGSTWNFLGAQVPSGSKSGILFSFTARQLSEIGVDLGFDDITADVLCETLFFGVVGDCDDYRRFKKAYNEGLEFAGIPLDDARGGLLAVEVLRHCPGDVTPGVEVSSKYGGIAGTHLGMYDPVFGGYAYYVPLVYAQSNGYNAMLYIQNGGLECSSVEIWFKEQDDCLRARICEIFALAPGETFQFDPNDCVGPNFQGSAWLRSSQPMGIAVDLIGHDVLMTYIGEPSELNYTFDPEKATFTQGNQVVFGPLVYSEYQGWDSGIQVQNLSSVHAAKAKVYFLDRSGDIITTLIDWICPRGSQTFFLPVVADLPGTWVGSVRVESQEWWSPGDPIVLPPNLVAIATLIKYTDAARSDTSEAIAYNMLPEHKIFDWQIGDGTFGGTHGGVGLIAIPSLLKDLPGTGVTTEVAIANVVPKPGFTDFAIFIYDQNGLLDYICEKLNEKQVEYIDLETWGYINPGFKGSAVISAVFWEHDVFDSHGNFVRNLLGLGAVMVERTGTRLGEDIPGDEAAGTAGIPFAESELEDNEFAFDFEGPAAPLCPGVGNRPAPGDCADTSVQFDIGPETGAPPPTLGGFSMTAFPPDPQPLFGQVTTVAAPDPPGGQVTFSIPLAHLRIGQGWGSWSHGYTGDVYYTNGAAAVTLTLPDDTAAFYFYVEPNIFATFQFEAVHSDGTSSGPISIAGFAGAHYFGFYSACGTLDSITITNTDGGAAGFAVGEFGIAEQPNN